MTWPTWKRPRPALREEGLKDFISDRRREEAAMKSSQKRLRAIELSLTPQQVVVVWLRNVLQAGTCQDAVRRTPRPRRMRSIALCETASRVKTIR